MKPSENCPFCPPAREVIMEHELCYAIYDQFPVSKGHALVIPVRHTGDYFSLDQETVRALWDLVTRLKEFLDKEYHPDGYNIGFNRGGAAGQTIDHVHIHVIPRYTGDMDDPRGGIRHCVKGKGYY
jgi:diadenosine tetraphosphate (Ap4A) HIT family hydrolase